MTIIDFITELLCRIDDWMPLKTVIPILVVLKFE